MSIPINNFPLTAEQLREQEEIAAKLPEKLQLEAEAARRAGYQTISDPVFFKWQRGEATEQDWKNAISQVEELYPVPTKA